VSIVNPARIAAYAKSRLARTKTDKADAALIAHFCGTQQPLPWTPPAAEVRELQALVRRVEMLQEMLQEMVQEMVQEMAQEMAQQEGNRQQSGIRSPAVLASLEATRAFLHEEMGKIHRQIQQLVEQSAALKGQQQLLCSIPGVAWRRPVDCDAGARGNRRSAHGSTAVNARQLAAYAGLCRPDTAGADRRKLGAPPTAAGEDRQ
jgi:transposase